MGDERKSLLIFDEAHAYEEIIFSHFWIVLKKLTYEQGVQTVLLSATLPLDLIKALKAEEHKYFPHPAHEANFLRIVDDNEVRTGQVTIEGYTAADEATEQAWQTYEQGKRVIMVVRRVVKPADDEEDAGKTSRTLQEI